MKPNTHRRGFTLIELLVVIAIIALMLSILMPSLSRVRAQARRVVCSSRIKQLLVASVSSANDDGQGRLPRGGLHSARLNTAQKIPSSGPHTAIFPPPTPPQGPENSDFTIDDASEMHIEEYFKIGAAMAGLAGDLGGSMTTSQVDRFARRVHQDGLKKLFVCPETERKGDMYDSPLPMYAGRRQYRPVIVPITTQRQPVWAARMGYLYFGGFETDMWDQPDAQGRRYRAPVKMTDPGHLALITDPLWVWPSRQTLVVPHTMRGYVELSGPAAIRQDVRQMYPSAVTAIGRLDGSVETRQLGDLDYRAAYAENGRYTVDLWTLF